ncbi:AraC family transcriptional regulator N-terminal domain-containing protein [Pseudomonas sp. NPDC007930]|uniref:AraC family transcriptional regulator n=1 Tax=Pseudomonas sp. NPDC007930 TaxID=3364417 RepID=UPI0036E4F625
MSAATEHTRPMVRLMEQLGPDEGYNLTALPSVRVLRSNRPLTRTPVLYEPGIVILCQGRKRGYLGEQLYLYDAQHYLVVALPVPFTMETDASAEEPMLALYLQLDVAMAVRLVEQADAAAMLPRAEPRGMFSSPMEPALAQSVLRLLEALCQPADAQVLGPALLRELYYRVLTGEQGGSLRAALDGHGRFGQIQRAINLIHARYPEPLAVEVLAEAACMSVPSFHLHFRAVTDNTPLQYLKSTRLHQARLLMLRGALNAQAAAYQVGYQSPSQFSREFKRFFGRSPQAEVQRMRAAYALPPPSEAQRYVSSH